MTTIPIKIPPGMYRNSTPYAGKARYVDGNLVRWWNDDLRAIGGWTQMVNSSGTAISAIVGTPATEVIRDGLQWADNANQTHYILGSNSNLYYISDSGAVSTITPAAYVGGSKDPGINTGYGMGPYGMGPYGVGATPGPNADYSLIRWKFSNWGEDVICSNTDPEYPKSIYSYSPGDAAALIIPNAPTDVHGAIVTNERIVMTIGSSTESRIVRWSDREDRETWTETTTNYAGSFKLQGQGALLSINSVLSQILILSETDAYVARFVGAPFVYGFTKVGERCGPICAGVVQSTSRFAVWFSEWAVWMYDGTLKEIPCDVMDFFKSDIRRDTMLKITSGVNSRFNEVWWLYQSQDSSGETDSYITFNYITGVWATGRLDRSVFVSGQGFSYPLMIDPTDSIPYTHEQDNVLAEGAWGATGPIDLNNGDINIAVSHIFPDVRTSGDVQFTLYGRDMPTSNEYTYGPYSFNNPVNTRAMGREVRMRVDGQQLNWRVGPNVRFKLADGMTPAR